MIDSEVLSLRKQKVPIVAIIGRPNVGKSTLFNRLIRKRRAITDAMPGVTRDIIPEKWLLGNHSVLLVDSGGVKIDKEGLDFIVTQKSLSLLEIADAIILLMDCTEVTAEDEMLLQVLRRHSDKVVLAVNKVDDPVRDVLVYDFHRFGYPRLVSLSSAHGLGIDTLEEELMLMLNLEEIEEADEVDQRIKIAVLGKPNTGKSTLTNALTGKDTSIVSDIPGTTRDVIMGEFSYKGSDFSILDTAGIRRKSKVDEDVEYYSVNRAIKTIDEADIVLLLIDVNTGLVEQDKKIAQLIVRKGKGVVLVFNKIDTLAGIDNELEAIKDRARFVFPILSFAPIVPISAEKGIDIDKMLDVVWAVWRQLNKRVDTAQLNNFLKEWSESYEPPRVSHRHYKIYYGTQVSANPVRFLFFVNRRKDFPEGYLRYLQNSIRRDLGFTQIPLTLDIKRKKAQFATDSVVMDIKAICFDIDGTMYPLWMTRLFLIATIFPSISLMQQTQKFRKAIREENGEKLNQRTKRGIERDKLVLSKELKTNLSVEMIKEKIDKQFYRRMESLFSHIRPFSNLRETMMFLKDMNIPIGALSDFPIDHKLDALKVADIVDYSACTEESGYLKPHRAPFMYVEKMMGVPLKNILYVGDSYDKDIVGANRVGMQTCLLLPHSHGKNKREKYKQKFPLADFIYSDYIDMKRQLQELFM